MTAPVLLLSLRLPPGAPHDDLIRLAEEVIAPALAALDDAPAVRCGLICSGEVLHALESEAPDALAALRERAADGRFEFLAAPLYEAHLDDMPEDDGVGQVQAHVALLKRLLAVRPRGLALPWGSYGSSVPRVAQRCGLDWVALYGAAGVCSLEVPGAAVRALGFQRRVPGDTHLGEAGLVDLRSLGWHQPDPKARAWFRDLVAGLPSTQLPSEAIDAGLPAPRRVWPEERLAARYRESWPSADMLHQRLMATSQLVARLSRDEGDGIGPAPDPTEVLQAQRYLWRAAAGDVFVDGDEGGIRCPEQRHRAWRDVLRAERVALEALRAARRPGVTRVDLDGDGVDELLLRSPNASARILPASRGALATLSIGQVALQLGALPRRTRAEWEQLLRPDPADPPEPKLDFVGEWTGDGQRPLTKQELYDRLREDVDPRLGFRDTFLHGTASLERFETGLLEEPTTGLDGVWEVESAERAGGGARCVLVGQGEYFDGDDSWPITIRKRYVLRGSDLEFKYEVQNRGLGVLRTRVLLPLDLSLGPEPDAHQVLYRGTRHPIDVMGDEAEVDLVRVLGAAGEVTVRTDAHVRLWHYPVHTVHRRRGEVRSSLQGVCLGLVWLLQLWARETASLTIRVAFQPT